MPSLTVKSSKSDKQSHGSAESGKKGSSLSSQFKNLFVKSSKTQDPLDSSLDPVDPLQHEVYSNPQSPSSDAVSPKKRIGSLSSVGSPGSIVSNGKVIEVSGVASGGIGSNVSSTPGTRNNSKISSDLILEETGMIPIQVTELLPTPSRSSSRRKPTSRNSSRERSSKKPLSRESSVTRRTSSQDPSSRRGSADSLLKSIGSSSNIKQIRAMPAVAFTEGSLRVFEDGSHDHVLKQIKVLEKAAGSSGGILSGFFKKSSSNLGNDVAFSLLPEQNRMDFQKRLSIQSRKTFDEEDEDNLDEEDEDMENNEAYDSDESSSDSSDDEGDEFDPFKVREMKFSKLAAIGDPQLNLINRLADKINIGEDASTNNNYKLTDKYGKLLGVIGKGSYGIVKLVSKYDTTGKKESFYAVKELKSKEGEDIKHFSTRLTSEFVISNSLNHLNIVKMMDLMQNQLGVYSEVMEFCPGGDLYTLVSKTHGDGLHHTEADCFMKQIMNGVTYMHSKGVAHCDLKPENILLTTTGIAKISDFGTSAVFRTAWEGEVHFSSGACGSEPYVAPEEFIQETYDPRLVDIWAVAVLYLVMLSGSYVWTIAKDSDHLYQKYLQSRPKPGKNGKFEPIENLKFSGDDYVKSRKVTLYGMLDPDPETRLTGEHVLRSDWLKNFKLCEASYSSHHSW